MFGAKVADVLGGDAAASAEKGDVVAVMRVVIGTAENAFPSLALDPDGEETAEGHGVGFADPTVHHHLQIRLLLGDQLGVGDGFIGLHARMGLPLSSARCESVDVGFTGP